MRKHFTHPQKPRNAVTNRATSRVKERYTRTPQYSHHLLRSVDDILCVSGIHIKPQKMRRSKKKSVQRRQK